MTKLFLLILLVAVAYAAVIPTDPATDATDATGKGGITVTVQSEQEFCSFLPRTPGEEIGKSEDDAIAFCTQASDKAPGAKIFPDGFIKTAHFKAEGSFVQVTGTMDGSKYQLSPSDGGGQYDSVGAPPGAICEGFEKFVNLVEPNDGIYCIRCCHNKGDCDTGHSEDGCRKIIPGDYS